MNVVGLVALFTLSKFSEVDPICMKDIRWLIEMALEDKISEKTIVKYETHMRKSLNYDIETPTVFDFIMQFVKTWKYLCFKEFKKIKRQP